MNILFLNDYNVTPYTGGIATLTSTLAEGFRDYYQCSCFLAFLGEDNKPTTPSFSSVLKVKRRDNFQDLKYYIKSNKIDFIISTLVGAKENYSFFCNFYTYIQKETQCKLFWIYLNRPVYDVFLTYQIQKIARQGGLYSAISKVLVKAIHWKVFQGIIKKNIQPKFLIPSTNCHAPIVLSEGYIPLFYKVSGLNKSRIIRSIGNPLVFKEELSNGALDFKASHILIVARLDESAKRFRLALKIWEKIEKQHRYDKWDLTIIGFGPDEQLIKSYAKKLKLNRVFFVGQQNPIEYYKRSSIYMMTSAFEGFPMVLNDAKQFGMVPVVFNSFEAVNDLIQDNYNGIIVENNDIELYTKKLMSLMDDEVRRRTLAENAMKSSKEFRVDKICQKWLNLYEEIKSN